MGLLSNIDYLKTLNLDNAIMIRRPVAEQQMVRIYKQCGRGRGRGRRLIIRTPTFDTIHGASNDESDSKSVATVESVSKSSYVYGTAPWKNAMGRYYRAAMKRVPLWYVSFLYFIFYDE